MSNSIFETLRLDFIKIRYEFSKDFYNEELLNDTIKDIKRIRAKIVKKTKVEGKVLILYCIDTLFEIIDENNGKKIFDFADTIHNMPEICLGKRNVYSFTEEILGFQKLYGKEYFPTFKKVKPRFRKKAPKNKWDYFSPDSDEDFKRLHPVGYVILVIIGIIAFLAPFVVYSIYVAFIYPPSPVDENISFFDFIAFMLGLIGTFGIGTGLFNIVAAWIDQYLGHFLTFVCFFGGGILTALSLLLLYI